MSIPERCHDARGLLLEVYDDHQPPTWAYTLLEEPLAARSFVGLAVVRSLDCREDGIQMIEKLGVPDLSDDVLDPRVVE